VARARLPVLTRRPERPQARRQSAEDDGGVLAEPGGDLAIGDAGLRGEEQGGGLVGSHPGQPCGEVRILQRRHLGERKPVATLLQLNDAESAHNAQK
jgi:hypothetical protein